MGGTAVGLLLGHRFAAIPFGTGRGSFAVCCWLLVQATGFTPAFCCHLFQYRFLLVGVVILGHRCFLSGRDAGDPSYCAGAHGPYRDACCTLSDISIHTPHHYHFVPSGLNVLCHPQHYHALILTLLHAYDCATKRWFVSFRCSPVTAAVLHGYRSFVHLYRFAAGLLHAGITSASAESRFLCRCDYGRVSSFF